MSAHEEEARETPLRKVLVAIVGVSPQVVTETLWALRRERGFIPDEIRVILTRAARDCVVHDLLDPLEGRFHAFCRDYGLVGRIRFDESCVTVVTDAEGRELDDIRTPEESAAAADTIVRVIGNVCSDPNTIVHVSIAGGRKSMGFFAGYAMSLFARPRDSVSHVLVNDPFEANRDFFYPPPEGSVENGMFVGDESDLEALIDAGKDPTAEHVEAEDSVRDPGVKAAFLAQHGYDELPEGYEVHHIQPISEGGADSVDNMILVSEAEHDEITAAHREYYGWKA